MRYILLIITLSMVACYAKKPEHTNKEGKKLPGFKVLQIDSTTWLNTKEIPTGKPIVVFIFGPNCPYSKAQMQDFLANKEELKDLDILAITPYPFGQMKKFYESYEIQKYPGIKMGVDRGNLFGSYISAEAVPFIAIYNKDKKLVSAFSGITPFDQIKEAAFN